MMVKILWKKQIFKDLENTIIGTPAISGIKNKNNTLHYLLIMVLRTFSNKW